MTDDSIRVAVLSDTHGMLRREVIEQLQGCSHILHAGDIITESDLDELALYGCLFAVRGNNDIWQPWAKHLAGILRTKVLIFHEKARLHLNALLSLRQN